MVTGDTCTRLFNSTVSQKCSTWLHIHVFGHLYVTYVWAFGFGAASCLKLLIYLKTFWLKTCQNVSESYRVHSKIVSKPYQSPIKSISEPYQNYDNRLGISLMVRRGCDQLPGPAWLPAASLGKVARSLTRARWVHRRVGEAGLQDAVCAHRCHRLNMDSNEGVHP